MKEHYFLYNYSIGEKNQFLEKVMDDLGDLVFVFELSTNKVIYHNNAFQPASNWNEMLGSPNIFDAIRNKLNANDRPVFLQMIQKIHGLADGDRMVRELHILTEPNFYGHYQLEFSLFKNSTTDMPSLILCKVHTIQEQNKMKVMIDSTRGFSKIVLIDDDELTNILNKKIIQSVLPDVEIEIFLDVDDALEWLKKNDQKGDLLIFLDINFPTKSGWDFLEDYQAFPVLSKVIMLSSSIVQSDKIKALSYKNVIQFLSKPLSFNFLEMILK